jgi:hypothetical protein
MKIKIEIDCDNDAFISNGYLELKRIFLKLVDVPEWEPIENLDNKKLYDSNGNFVGKIKVSE